MRAVLPLLLLAACTHDDAPASPAGIPLPPDTYPLRIASVTISADGQPRTRLTDEGNSTKWQDNDQIMVSLGDQQAIYTYTGGEWHSNNPLCWESTAPQVVNAWYPVDETIDFTQQDKGLTYLLKAEPVNATYNQSTPINLTFTHQLAKVRVLLNGEKAQDVEKVYVRSYPTSTHTQGKLGGLPTGSTADYFPMYKTTYEEKECWEATLRDGHLEADNTFEVANAAGKRMRVMLAQKDMRIAAGQVYTINISVNPVVPEDATDITNTTGEINDKGDYVVSGERNTTINITGGSPTIYLDGATVSVASGNAINISNNATPTIYVVGENNKIISNSGAGICVEEGSTVTIQGSGRSDVLKSTARSDGAGIGGNSYVRSCGNINIKNVTVYASNNNDTDIATMCNPGIGGYRECGTITIKNATVYAYATAISSIVCPAIGSLYMIPTIIISNNSEVYAHRGFDQNPSPADWIGIGATYEGEGGQIQATVTNSTVHCYTGETLDKTVVYDDQGNDKEITQ